MSEIVVADIGGTHARFAIADVAGGEITGLHHPVKMRCSEHSSLQIAWEAYAAQIMRPLPRDGAIAVAGPVGGDVIYFTNSSWLIRPHLVPEKLGLDRFTLINDFGAVGHAVARLDAAQFSAICGPVEIPVDGVISVIGPGTGLGVAQVLRRNGHYTVVETEGGHVDFAPLDAIDDRLLASLRLQHRRVSAERIASGPGLAAIYAVVAEMEGQAAKLFEDKELWTLALSGEDSLIASAFDRFCLCLGSVAGDIALIQGANRVVMAGGLGNRISGALPSSGFRERFVAKGRFQSRMEGICVQQLTYDEPGLFGAAAAFLHEHGEAG